MSQDRYRDEHAPQMPGFVPVGTRFELVPGATSSIAARSLTGASEGPGSLRALFEERDALAKFKAYVHQRLDEVGVPVDPESEHKAAGCRIGGRLDWLIGERAKCALDIERIINECDENGQHEASQIANAIAHALSVTLTRCFAASQPAPVDAEKTGIESGLDGTR